MKDMCIICDLDGTLIANQHRPIDLYLKPTGGHDWDRWLKDSVADPISPWCEELCMAMADRGNHLVFLTGRRETNGREVTERWLLNHGFEKSWYTLIMRGQDDFRDAPLVKLDALTTKILPFWDVLFAVDDLAANAEIFRNLGIICLHCANY